MVNAITQYGGGLWDVVRPRWSLQLVLIPPFLYPHCLAHVMRGQTCVCISRTRECTNRTDQRWAARPWPHLRHPRAIRLGQPSSAAPAVDTCSARSARLLWLHLMEHRQPSGQRWVTHLHRPFALICVCCACPADCDTYEAILLSKNHHALDVTNSADCTPGSAPTGPWTSRAEQR